MIKLLIGFIFGVFVHTFIVNFNKMIYLIKRRKKVIVTIIRNLLVHILDDLTNFIINFCNDGEDMYYIYHITEPLDLDYKTGKLKKGAENESNNDNK